MARHYPVRIKSKYADLFTPKKILSKQNVMFQSKSVESILAFCINNVT